MSTLKVFKQFLKIGSIAFGGPAAHIGVLEQELVSRKKWVKPQDFLDYIGIVNMIPGPNSVQLTMLIGYKICGLRGMSAAAVGFILPAFAITAALAWMYVRMGSIPLAGDILFGIKPAVIAVIAAAITRLGGKALKNPRLVIIAVLAMLSSFLGINEIWAIIGGGLLGLLWFEISRGFSGKFMSVSPLILLGLASGAAKYYSPLKLFWIFFKIGGLLFGSGYVLIAYMDAELIQNAGWLSRQQLLDAVAIGQFTPGPLLTAATFAGFLIHGWSGAVIATVAMVLPSFFYIFFLYPHIPRLRKSPHAGTFLDFVIAAAVGVMAAISIVMAAEVVVDFQAAGILIASLGAVFVFPRISAAWIILAGGMMGFLLGMIEKQI
jgi:chromate transporter